MGDPIPDVYRDTGNPSVFGRPFGLRHDGDGKYNYTNLKE